MFSADLALIDGKIRTLDDRNTVAQALACYGDVIAAVGATSEISKLIGPSTRVVDLGGRTVLPGFIDAHEHLSWFAEGFLNLDLSPASAASREALLERLRAEASRKKPGEWIRAVGFDDTKSWTGDPMNREDLDRAAPDNPVIVIHVSGHWAVVNTRAMDAGRLGDDSPDPAGGALGRDPATGRLTGLLLEMAMFNFAFESLAVTPTVVPPYPAQVRYQAVRKAGAFLNAAGITGVGDALTSPSYIQTYLELARDNALPVRVNMLVPYIFLDRIKAVGLSGRWGNRWVRSSGIKIIVDGSISGRTAALGSGYANNPDDHGVLLIQSQQDLDDIVRAIHDRGFQACIHANGDVAIEMALNSIERAMAANPRLDPRHRIEHCTMVDDDTIERMKKLGVTPLPFVSYVWQHSEKLKKFYGPMAANMFAHCAFTRAGLMPASGSDHPVGLYSPLLGIQCMVTRRGSDGDIIGEGQRIGIEDAVRVYTTSAARASFEEHIRGALTPHRLADMVVLGRDPWETPPDEIARISVDMTFVGGRFHHGEF